MNNFLDELKQSEKLLQEGKYIDCSIKCGKIIELFLKSLLKKYAKEGKLVMPQPFKSKSIDRLSLGDIFHLIDNDNFIGILTQDYNLNKNNIRSYFNKIIVQIRNNAVHNPTDDGKAESKAGAFIIFGHLLYFHKLGFIIENENVQIPSEIINNINVSKTRVDQIPVKMKRRIVSSDAPSLKQTRNQIFEYRIRTALAKMVIKQQGTYTILRGSTAIREEKGSIPENAKSKRRELINSSKLTPDLNRDVYIFKDDVDFSSPSAASCVIAASSTNGWREFKDSTTNIPLKNVYRPNYARSNQSVARKIIVTEEMKRAEKERLSKIQYRLKKDIIVD